MIIKKVAANNIIPLNETEEKPSSCCGTSCNCFKQGSKFNMDGQDWIVLEELICDNMPMRKISSSDGTIEIVSLSTLKKDLKIS
jgi:hypothetical protein